MLYPRAQTVRSTFQNCTSDHHIYQNAGAVQLNILFKCMGYSGWKRYRVEVCRNKRILVELRIWILDWLMDNFIYCNKYSWFCHLLVTFTWDNLIFSLRSLSHGRKKSSNICFYILKIFSLFRVLYCTA